MQTFYFCFDIWSRFHLSTSLSGIDFLHRFWVEALVEEAGELSLFVDLSLEFNGIFNILQVVMGEIVE